ncbi:MAG: hypothetical protein KGL43_18920 [Burkholderiales bacterium]|nr:hypothetical protein [Burkholderiales bacterium]
MAGDLETLAPTPREVTAKGDTVAIAPFYFGQFPRVMGLLRQIGQQVQGTGIMSISTGGGNAQFSLASNWAERLPEVFEQAGEPWLDLLAMAIGKPRKWFDTLAADEGLLLSQAMVEVNLDFFARKLLPLIQGMTGAPISQATGAPSSPDSSPSGTGSPTSTATP